MKSKVKRKVKTQSYLFDAISEDFVLKLVDFVLTKYDFPDDSESTDYIPDNDKVPKFSLICLSF